MAMACGHRIMHTHTHTHTHIYTHTHTPTHVCRANSLWALRNIAYKASYEEKEKIVACLGFPTIADMLESNDVDIRSSALTLIKCVRACVRLVGLLLRVFGWMCVYAHVHAHAPARARGMFWVVVMCEFFHCVCIALQSINCTGKLP